MQIAFIVSYFPSVSETFILNQIVGLLERGYEVDIYAEQIGNNLTIHPDVKKSSFIIFALYSNSLAKKEV